MNSTLTEQLGINALEHILLLTKRIEPNIKKMDKYPIWDGELLLYNDETFSAENLNVRVPVQIKSELFTGVADSIEKYSVKVSHLQKYEEEGGVLFIKTIVNQEDDKTYFYSNLLMKADIVELLKDVDKKQKNKTVELYKFDNGNQIITKCLNYKLHKPLQMQLPAKNSLKSISKIYTYGYVDKLEDIVTKEHYGYVKVEGDVLEYIGKVKTDTLYGTKNVPVFTEKKKYYDFVTEVIKENDHYYKINDNAIIKDGKITLDSYAKKELKLSIAIDSLEFVEDLYDNKKIKIGNSKLASLTFDDVDKEKLELSKKNVKNNLNFLYSAKNTFSMLNIPIDTVSVSDAIEIENEICKIRDVIFNKEKITFDNETRDSFVLIDKMKDITFLIYFIKQEDGTYIGYDYLNCDEVLNNIKIEIEGEMIQLSRYYNLKAETIIGLNINVEKMLLELKNCTKNTETIDFICYLMMEFIKAYDITNDKKYLIVAEKINKYLRKNRNYYSENYFKINKYQIIKRMYNKLDLEDINKLTYTKIKTDDIFEKISCCILLEQYDEFVLYFNEIIEAEKDLYKRWSIFDLLPEDYKKKIK